MDVFIYFPLGLEIPRDEIEDAIQDCLGERGEVTGGGAGARGSNLDLELFEEEEGLIEEIKLTLRRLGVPPTTTLVVDGKEVDL
jgi:hypothetical protein